MLRAVTIAICLGAAAYSGFWFYAADTAKKATQTAIENATARGYGISYSNLEVKGFPSRIDQTASDLSVTFPDGRSGVDLPWVQVFALSYQPNRVIAAFPETAVIRAGGQELALTSERLRASLDVGFDTSLPIERIVAEGGAMALATGEGPLGAASLLAAVRRSPATGADTYPYDIYAELQGITLPPALLARLDPAGSFPPAQSLTIDGTARLAAPLTVKAPPVLEHLALRSARLDWGETGLTLSGDLTPDAMGRATGTVEVALRNWPQLLQLAAGAGLITAEQEQLFAQALQLFGRGSETLAAPITLDGGQMRLGFIPLGPAPALPFTLPQ